jgi:hypothetical protein
MKTLRATLEEWPASQKEISEAADIPFARLARCFSMEPGFWIRIEPEVKPAA